MSRKWVVLVVTLLLLSGSVENPVLPVREQRLRIRHQTVTHFSPLTAQRGSALLWDISGFISKRLPGPIGWVPDSFQSFSKWQLMENKRGREGGGLMCGTVLHLPRWLCGCAHLSPSGFHHSRSGLQWVSFQTQKEIKWKVKQWRIKGFQTAGTEQLGLQVPISLVCWTSVRLTGYTGDRGHYSSFCCCLWLCRKPQEVRKCWTAPLMCAPVFDEGAGQQETGCDALQGNVCTVCSFSFLNLVSGVLLVSWLVHTVSLCLQFRQCELLPPAGCRVRYNLQPNDLSAVRVRPCLSWRWHCSKDHGGFILWGTKNMRNVL